MFRPICKPFILLASALLLISVVSAAIPTAPSDGTIALLQKAVNGDWRSAAHKARDQYRHPIETLQFFGLKPDMTVIELQPGGGWYTEILAPVLYAHGHLLEASDPKFADKIKANPAVFGHIGKIIPFDPPKQLRLGDENSADMVLSFRNAHDWLMDRPETLDAVFKAVFDVLKPGGAFGFEEHRAKPFATATESAMSLHRIPEDYLIAVALKTGFRVGGVSEVNANPKDPEDINVHRLPPDLSGPAAEHAKMQAIGESDRMTIRFVKP
jgi:predicted methyltransferase